MERRKILIVDDDDAQRKILRMFLRALDCEVLEATNGVDGLRVLREERPDLVLLDFNMPEMDGSEVLRTIRADREVQATPVIMLTCISERDVVVEIGKLGVAAYIVKPFRRDSLLKTISEALDPAPTVHPEAPPRRDAETAATQTSAAPRVLVVDDAPRVLQTVRAALEPLLPVGVATSGPEALAQFDAEPASIVVIDLEMPEMDGCETLAAFRRVAHAPLRAIALCVRGDAQARERALGTGFDAVVEKPVDVERLIAEVRRSPGFTREPEETVETLDDLFRHEGACPVLVFPHPTERLFVSFGPFALRMLRRLVEDGHDALVLDLSRIDAVRPDVVNVLAELIVTTANLRVRLAVSVREKVVAKALATIVETRNARYVHDIEAAWRALDCAPACA